MGGGDHRHQMGGGETVPQLHTREWQVRCLLNRETFNYEKQRPQITQQAIRVEQYVHAQKELALSSGQGQVTRGQQGSGGTGGQGL